MHLDYPIPINSQLLVTCQVPFTGHPYHVNCHDGCDGDFTPGNEITFERMGGKDDNGDESNAHAIRAIDPHGNQAGWIWRDLAVTLSPLMMNRKF